MLLLFLEIRSVFAFSYLGLWVLPVTVMQLFSSQAGSTLCCQSPSLGPFVCPCGTADNDNANSEVSFTTDGATPGVVSASALPSITVQEWVLFFFFLFKIKTQKPGRLGN